MPKKIIAIGLAALLTAMVTFAALAEIITRLFVAGQRESSRLPFIAFIPALIIAGALAWLAWRSERWLRFAGVQIAIFAVLFVVLLALGL